MDGVIILLDRCHAPKASRSPPSLSEVLGRDELRPPGTLGGSAGNVASFMLLLVADPLVVVADSPGPLALRCSSRILGVLWLRSLCRAAPRCPGRVGGSSPPAGARSRQAERLVSCRQRGRGCALASITSCRKSLHLPRCELTGALPSGCPPLPARAGVSYANRCSRFPN